MVITTHMMHKILETKKSENKDSSEIQVLQDYLKKFGKQEKSQEITS